MKQLMVFTEVWIGTGCMPGSHFVKSFWREIILARDISRYPFEYDWKIPKKH